MGCFMDRVQQREQEDRDRLIQNARSCTAAPSAFLCQACDGEIPAARRAVIPGVQCCVTCQEIAELKGKHYNGGAV
ncbi:TraR/DksA family transcriptional regulator [Pseudescherichia sp.]|uniref:TraR/DksA family transcriptional regulator n=1 Tax=Pseudescherichia sp. TaxID=2055881 RepID=UPI0028969949|nr:TraR/DksA family transcriptional regulator [Pseudescherichia sp.]